MDELYQQIINIYKETGSVKKTAEELGTYPIKVVVSAGQSPF